jgi:hypothetical protein
MTDRTVDAIHLSIHFLDIIYVAFDDGILFIEFAFDDGVLFTGLVGGELQQVCQFI